MSEKRELWELQSMQAAPLSVKISLTKTRIREWVNKWGEDGVYVSFSGGKDSTVLLHLVREEYPNIPAVFVDTGLEFPEIRQFVKTFDNVIWLKPKLTFRQVIEKYGYPFIRKEVAECVYGARKYLKSIIGNTPPQYEYYFKKLCGSDQYQKLDRGGDDRKYRKLRGLAEFTKVNRQRSCSTPDGNPSEEGQSDDGEYP